MRNFLISAWNTEDGGYKLLQKSGGKYIYIPNFQGVIFQKTWMPLIWNLESHN